MCYCRHRGLTRPNHSVHEPNYSIWIVSFSLQLIPGKCLSLSERAAQARIKYPNWKRELELDGYIGACKENNPIVGIIHRADPNLLVMVAIFQNNAGQEASPRWIVAPSSTLVREKPRIRFLL